MQQWQRDYIDAILIPAQEGQLAGIFTSVTLAQAILEPGWGKQTPIDKYTGKKSYNLFGIKGTGPNGFVTCDTWEYWDQDGDGKPEWIKVEAKFRAYHDWGESIDGHTQFLIVNPRYYKVFQATTPEQQCRELKAAGYATGPTYDQSLINMINDYDLKQFDLSKEDIQMIQQLNDRVAKLEEIIKQLVSDKEYTQDQLVSNWAAKAVEKANKQGVLVGDGYNLNPKRALTREEYALTLDRLGLLGATVPEK